LDGEAVPNIISLDLIKKLGIKELLKDPGKYITANGQRSQVFILLKVLLSISWAKL